jgi:hypothetical protein
MPLGLRFEMHRASQSLGPMTKLWLLVLLLLAISGCAAPQSSRRPILRPDIEEFRAGITYPYYAPLARRQQMERGAPKLRKGMTEAEVLELLGLPDYKARWFYPVDTLRGEVWVYVHTWERPITPEYYGKTLAITLDETVRPRTLLDFDTPDFGTN